MAVTSSPLVHLAIEGPVARVELDRPPVNAFDDELVAALAEVVAAIPSSGARAVIFAGRGPSLAAGGDVKFMQGHAAAGDAAILSRYFRAIQRLFDDVERLPMPTLAMIRGNTLGGGFELALACDLRVAAEDARVGFPEATLGLLPAAGGTQRLTELAGRGDTFELLYTGRVITATEARAYGLVNRVVPAVEIEAAANELIAALLRSTDSALAAVKACVRARIEDGRPAGSRTESRLIEALAADPAAIERVTAFVERRPAATKSS